ncbi:MAG: type II toxin-antitoxin system VapC family toxin [Holophagales bacterium]|nr:type II toxin-antitoxin system VapC family toxin [Acidobacteriota bacterium]MXW02694.1 type II toxin-antitoxin system VapC family toxin [Holophagales bacterium]MYC10007.1 type II toxin-antitoxin system VapC family toxin [Holophagales bacterium]
MLRYLLDTNVVSQLIRRPDGRVAQRVAELEPGSFAINVIVAAELRYGAERRGSSRLTRQLEAVLSAIDVLPLEEPVDRHYGEIRSELERSGQPIGFNDLLIAAHARALGLTLVTNNVGEFRRVSGLSVEDWQ